MYLRVHACALNPHTIMHAFVFITPQAHQHNVRFHVKANVHVDDLSDAHAAAARIAAKAHEAFADGVNFDLESPLADASVVQKYTDLVRETASLLRQKNAASLVTVDVPWSPANIDGRSYDWAGLADAADYLFVMAYDMRSQIWDECTASANSPPAQVEMGLQQYFKLGIQPVKLVLGLPWYAYDYSCVEVDVKDNFCGIDRVPFRGAPCSDAAGRQRPLMDVYTLLLDSSNATRPMLDSLLVSKSFFYSAPSPPSSSPVSHEAHMVWFDDADTLRTKYSVAHTLDLGGIGMWNIDCISYSDRRQQPMTAAMLEALREYRSDLFDPGRGVRAIHR